MSGPRPDPYRILGVARGASLGEISRAYRRRAKELHPDLHGADAVAAMRELNHAIRLLSDPATRRAWDAAHPVRRDHWAAGTAARPDATAPPDPAAWTAWEAHPAAVAPYPARARVSDAWPRDGAQAVPAGGVRDSAWLAVGVALAIVVGALLLGSLASSSTLARSGREAIVRLGVTPIGGYPLDPDHEVGVFVRSAGVIGLVAAERQEGGWTARVLTETTTSDPLSVLLYVDEAAGGSALPSIAFGRAEGGVAEVRVQGEGERRATVVQGTWSMPVPGIRDAGQLGWEFVLADGTVLRGSGELGG